MTTPIGAGVDLSTKVLQKAGRQMDSYGNWTVTLTYAVLTSAAYSEAPARADAIPAPYSTDHPSLICVGSLIDDNPDGRTSTLEVTYATPTGFLLAPGSGAIRSTRAAINEKLVDEELTTASEAEAAKALDRRVITRFTVEYSRRSVESSFTWSEANVVSGVGKRQDPTGMTSPTANRWLKVERAATELASGGDVELTETWQYDENGWNTTIYAT